MSKLGPHSVLVIRDVEQGERKTLSGIIIPIAKEQTKVKGKVVRVGTGTNSRPMEAIIGDIVHYESLSAIKVDVSEGKCDLVNVDSCIYIEA